MNRFFTLFFAAILLASVASTSAFATCHSTGGKKYCKNGYWWKCEKCGSEYCEILQAGDGRCHHDDERFEVSELSQLMQRTVGAPREIQNYSPRPRSRD